MDKCFTCNSENIKRDGNNPELYSCNNGCIADRCRKCFSLLRMLDAFGKELYYCQACQTWYETSRVHLFDLYMQFGTGGDYHPKGFCQCREYEDFGKVDYGGDYPTEIWELRRCPDCAIYYFESQEK